jgi:hypothetical protein
MSKTKKLAPLTVARQRIEAVAQWFATDAEDLEPDELTKWRKWFSPTGPTATEAVARAMAPIAEGGLGIPRRDRAERVVSKAAEQWSLPTPPSLGSGPKPKRASLKNGAQIGVWQSYEGQGVNSETTLATVEIVKRGTVRLRMLDGKTVYTLILN